MISGKAHNRLQTATPLVSFIIPCYNVEEALLEECLESVLALRLKPDEREVIVVNDGSTVSYVHAIHKYSAQVVFLSIQHSGLSVARNRGMDVAQGRYIQFVDADDRLLTAGYNRCLALLRRLQPDILLFRFTRLPNEPKTGRLLHVQPGTAYLLHHNLHAAACGYLFRRSLTAQLRFMPNLLHEDELFTPLLLLRARTVLPTTLCAYYYRPTAGSITQRASADWIERRISNTLKIIETLQEKSRSFNDARQQAALQRRITQLSMDWLLNVLQLTGAGERYRQATGELHAIGLYPLPQRSYGLRYRVLAVLLNHSCGARIVRKVLKMRG